MPVIDTRRSIDQTVRVFDSFYSQNFVVNSNEWDVVRSYFIGVCADDRIADNFTTFLFRISQESSIPIMELLEAIRGLDRLNMNRVLAYYMNSYKSSYSMYGVAVVSQPNQYATRNIVQ